MVKNNFFENIINNFIEGVYFVDIERRITFWSKGAERITGFSSEEVIDHKCYDNILNHVDEEGTQLCLHGCPLHKSMDDGIIRETCYYLLHKHGYRVKVFARTIPIYEENIMIGAVEVFEDNQDKVTIMSDIAALKELSMYDHLTAIPNRRYMDAYLSARLGERHLFNMQVGILFIDIDLFKNINDTYGHEMGDRVLKMVSRTFQNAVRNNDVVGRWGGEEFVVILTGVSIGELTQVAEKIRMLVQKSGIRDGKQKIHVTVSIGATLAVADDSDSTVVNRADQLMYKSKQNGRNQVTIG